MLNSIASFVNTYQGWKETNSASICTWAARGAVFIGSSLYDAEKYGLSHKENGLLKTSTFLSYLALTTFFKKNFPKYENSPEFRIVVITGGTSIVVPTLLQKLIEIGVKKLTQQPIDTIKAIKQNVEKAGLFNLPSGLIGLIVAYIAFEKLYWFIDPTEEQKGTSSYKLANMLFDGFCRLADLIMIDELPKIAIRTYGMLRERQVI
jgi:hypothetical protein